MTATNQGRSASSRSSDASSPQDALSALVVAGLSTLDDEVERLVRPMDGARRVRQPADGGWSIDAILEHLCLAGERYLARMSQALAAGGARRERGRWRPTIGGRLLARSMVSSWKLRAPSMIVPGPVPRPDVLDAFLLTNASIRDLLHSAVDVEWRGVRFASPFARWLTLNLGDAALVLLRHGERHHQQMQRVARSLSG